jgi:hypothetical protein
VLFRSGAASPGGVLSVFVSGVGGKSVKTLVAAWAWCLWLLLLVFLAPPPNKLKIGLIQDLDLGSLVAADDPQV